MRAEVKNGINATLIDWDIALVWIDNRKDYSEQRECALGVIGDRVYFCAFTRRGRVLRIISLREDNLREAKYYVKNS
ncbi:MAG TPA: BrnT family toxin [Herbaspirillum sp.]|nr:BrnT family toxin [Herbaspirillum sp.]